MKLFATALLSLLIPFASQALPLFAESAAQRVGNADGSLANAVSPFQIAARIGGETLKDHLELFLDQSGRPIIQKK